MIWFWSDQHFECDNLVRLTRPEFTDINQHDEYLLDQCNSFVAPNDRLIILGDWCKNKPGKYRQKVKCKNIFFILGNHDNESKIRNVFGGNVFYQRMIKLVSGEKCLCSHHPQAFWDGSHHGTYHAYGHLHDNDRREAMMDLGFPGRRSMDVGVDAAKRLFGTYRPISEEEFLFCLRGRPGHDPVLPHEKWEKKDYGHSSVESE